jgi:hypothetical protein
VNGRGLGAEWVASADRDPSVVPVDAEMLAMTARGSLVMQPTGLLATLCSW